MKIERENSRFLKPLYETSPIPSTDVLIPLNPFDTVGPDNHVPTLYAYRPPNPPNTIIEQGLRKALSVYREFAGRIVNDDSGRRCILLNDDGMLIVEAKCDDPLAGSCFCLGEPTPAYLELHPPTEGVPEPSQVQLTRFACGSLVVGLTTRHAIADGAAATDFLVAWGRATRNLPLQTIPFHDRSIFVPRNPPFYQFDHRGVEYVLPFEKDDPSQSEAIVVHRAHFPTDFLQMLKTKASSFSSSPPDAKPFTTFECLAAHLWRKITKARSLDSVQTTKIKIAVNGRPRITNPPVPADYFGNLVLWALPESKVGDLLRKPVSHAARLIHDAVGRLDDNYFRSFIDFSNSTEKMEGLVQGINENQKVLSPDLKLACWLGFPFYELDFGEGRPYLFSPSYIVQKGLLVMVPSFTGNGDIDVMVALFEKEMEAFKDDCYVLD